MLPCDCRLSQPPSPPSCLALLSETTQGPKPTRAPALPVSWFFLHASGRWSPFSRLDNSELELVYKDAKPGAAAVTDGGRYTVDIETRARIPVFWDEPSNPVRRASWFLGHEELDPMAEADAAIIEVRQLGPFRL